MEETSVKDGTHTTEFWASSLVSLVLVVNAIFDLGIDIDDQTAMKIVGGVTAAYAFARSIPKAFSKGK